MESRKLIKLGNNSHVISLPNSWLKKNNLNKGNLVYINENGNNEVILSPEIKKEEEKLSEITIDVDKKTNHRLRREIISAYINDFNIIQLVGEEIPGKSRFIRNVINNHLMAIEVMEQTSNRILTKDFLDIKYDSASEIIKRMDITLRSMIFDLKSASYQSIEDREREINKWFFLMMRVERSLLTTTKCSTTKEIADVLRYCSIARTIEEISDRVKRLSSYLAKLDRKNTNVILRFWEKIEQYYLESIKAYYKQNTESAYKLSDLKKEYYTSCSKLMNRKASKKEFYQALEIIRFIIKFIHSIGHVTYT